MVSEGKSSDKVTHKVKAPATQVSCEEVGNRKLASHRSGMPEGRDLQRFEQTHLIQRRQQISLVRLPR